MLNIKNTWRFWLLVVLLLTMLTFSIGSFVYFRTECKHSQQDPMVYSAIRADAVQCSCLLENGNTINFDKTRVWQNVKLKPSNNYNYSEEINFSAILVKT